VLREHRVADFLGQPLMEPVRTLPFLVLWGLPLQFLEYARTETLIYGLFNMTRGEARRDMTLSLA